MNCPWSKAGSLPFPLRQSCLEAASRNGKSGLAHAQGEESTFKSKAQLELNSGQGASFCYSPLLQGNKKNPPPHLLYDNKPRARGFSAQRRKPPLPTPRPFSLSLSLLPPSRLSSGFFRPVQRQGRHLPPPQPALKGRGRVAGKTEERQGKGQRRSCPAGELDQPNPHFSPSKKTARSLPNESVRPPGSRPPPASLTLSPMRRIVTGGKADQSAEAFKWLLTLESLPGQRLCAAPRTGPPPPPPSPTRRQELRSAPLGGPAA